MESVDLLCLWWSQVLTFPPYEYEYCVITDRLPHGKKSYHFSASFYIFFKICLIRFVKKPIHRTYISISYCVLQVDNVFSQHNQHNGEGWTQDITPRLKFTIILHNSAYWTKHFDAPIIDTWPRCERKCCATCTHFLTFLLYNFIAIAIRTWCRHGYHYGNIFIFGYWDILTKCVETNHVLMSNERIMIPYHCNCCILWASRDDYSMSYR